MFTSEQHFKDDDGNDVTLRWQFGEDHLLATLDVVDPTGTRRLHHVTPTPQRPRRDAEEPLPLENL